MNYRFYIFILCFLQHPIYHHKTLAQSNEIDSLLSLVKKSTEHSNKSARLLELAKLTYAQDLQKAVIYAENSKRSALLSRDKTVLARSQQMIGIIHYFSSSYDSAITYVQLAGANYLIDADTGGYAAIKNLEGNINVATFQKNKALNCFQEAKMAYLSIGDTAALASVLSNIGTVYYENDQYDKAFDVYLQSLAIHKKRKNKLGIAQTLNNIAVIYNKSYQYNQALDFFLRARNYYLELSNKESTLNSTLNLAKVYNSLSKHKMAYRLLKDDLDSNELLNISPKFKLIYLGEMAKIQFGLKNYNKGLTIINQAIDLAKELNDTSTLVINVISKAEFLTKTDMKSDLKDLFDSTDFLLTNYKDQSDLANYRISKASYFNLIKKYPEAIRLCLPACSFFERNKRFKDFDTALKIIAKSYQLSGKFEMGNAILYKQLSIRDSFFSSKNTWKLAQVDIKRAFGDKQIKDSMETAFFKMTKNNQISFEKSKLKQQEIISIASVCTGFIILLFAVFIFYVHQKTKKKNKEISDQKDSIQRRNTQIEWLLKEIHHRVKNNLQIVSSLMSIQGRALDDEKSKNLIRESQNRIKSMGLVHESLYQAEDLSEIDIQPFITRIAEGVNSSLKANNQKINLNIHSENLKMNAEQAVPIGIIINELASNAYKHSFKNRVLGELTISLSKENQSLRLSIDDDGPSLPDDFKIDFAGQSIGLALVKSLAEDQLEGQFSWGQAVNQKFQIIFPHGTAA